MSNVNKLKKTKSVKPIEKPFIRKTDLEHYFAAIKQHATVKISDDGLVVDEFLYNPSMLRYYANLGFYPLCYDAIHQKLVLAVKRNIELSLDEGQELEDDDAFCEYFVNSITYYEANFFQKLMPKAFSHVKTSSDLTAILFNEDAFDELLQYAKNPHKVKEYERQKRMADSRGSGIISEDYDNEAAEWLDRILTYCVLHRATDIHFEWTGENYVVRMRVDGDLHLYPSNEDPMEIPEEYYAPLINIIRLGADLDITEHFVPQDGQMKFDCQFVDAGKTASSYDMRVSIIPEVEGKLNCVLRVQQKGVFKKLESLGFTKTVEKEVGKICAEPHGLILVTGPTGSGKTTTLYSMLKPNVKILTAEDPVEIHMKNVTQVGINLKQKRTFASLLRSFLRHDPDVILVGEIRDVETAKIAIDAANTGHLVLSTLHTNDAPSAIKRLGNMEGIEPAEFAFALKGIMAQRLTKIYNKEIREGLSNQLPND